MNRTELQELFKTLRNAQMKHYQGVRIRRIYFSHLIDSDGLAEMKTYGELVDVETRNKLK